MLKWLGRSPNDDLRRQLRPLKIAEDTHNAPLAPSLGHESFDGVLVAEIELFVSVHREQEEALEVTESVVEQSDNLAGLLAPVLGWVDMVMRLDVMRDAPRRRGQDLSRLPAEAGNSTGDELEVS